MMERQEAWETGGQEAVVLYPCLSVLLSSRPNVSK
jgi:hypothetical protein